VRHIVKFGGEEKIVITRWRRGRWWQIKRRRRRGGGEGEEGMMKMIIMTMTKQIQNTK
jgi:hypothetical protein